MIDVQKPMFEATLSVTLIRADGSHIHGGIYREVREFARHPISWWRCKFEQLKPHFPWLAAMGFAAFLRLVQQDDSQLVPMLGIVTTVGIQFEMTAFVSGSNPLTNMKYHDCGTGSAAPNISDTGLQAAFGGARVSGAQSNPTSTQFQSQATIIFPSSITVTEWGLFSALTSGTLWDRRLVGPYTMGANESIQFTYLMNGTAGGS